MTLTCFVFSKGKWIEQPTITEYNMVLLMDPENKSLYLWQGDKFDVNFKSEARRAISELIDHFPSFKLREIDENTPKNILKDIQLRKNSTDKLKTSYHKKLGRNSIIINSISIVLLIVAMIIYFNDKTTSFMISLIVLFSGILVIGSIFFEFAVKDKKIIIPLAIAVIIDYLSVLVFWNKSLNLFVNPLYPITISLILILFAIILELKKYLKGRNLKNQ